MNRSLATAANVYLLLYPKAHFVHAVTDKTEEFLRSCEQFIPNTSLARGGSMVEDYTKWSPPN